VNPAEIEVFTDADFEATPALVRGYIGPARIAPEGSTEPQLGIESASGIRYLLDPRIVSGTRWITGANQPGRHVFDLAAGRDFTGDGTSEAAGGRAGAPAPDASGPVEPARGSEIGHIFALGRPFADALGLAVLDQNGKQVTVTMGSYGIGVTRAVAALAESNRDERGLVWPRNVAPADALVVTTGNGDQVNSARV